MANENNQSIPKMSGESMDIVADNIAKLKELFPEILTENKIDFNTLKALLGEVLEEAEERYSFTWHGKTQARRLAQTPSTGTLRPFKEESVDWDTTQNLYIEGDNLEVLKLLQKSYHKQVKMIYIDPPYNTGRDFVYSDNFKDNIQNYLELTGQVESGKKIGTNTEASGRYHTDWLNMMLPRLKLARNLLSDDGMIFISIDDGEASNLRKLCDEIFGEDNFIDSIVWKKRYGGGAKEKHLVTLHEYILVYAKNIDELGEIFIPLAEQSIERYYKLKDSNFDVRGPYRTHPLEAGKAVDERPNLVFPIIAPDGSEINPKRQWYWSKDRVQASIGSNELEFMKDKNGEWSVHSKQYLKDETGELRQAKAFSIIENVFSQHGTNEILECFGNAKVFSYPKPTNLLSQLIEISTDSNQNDLILDFFSGSSSTACATLKLNLSDLGNRRYILVQLPEACDESSDAYNSGYKTISDIGKERLRRIAKKIKEENIEYQGDIGFKVLKLNSSNLKPWDADFDSLATDLAEAADIIKANRSNEDVLFEILLKYGLDLTLPIETHQLAGKTVYEVGAGALIVCLDDGVTEAVAEAIGKLKEILAPEVMRVVFKDSSFASDAAKVNAVQVLKQYGIEDVKAI